MVPTYICPSDIKKGETDTMLPSGKVMRVYIREIDVENVKRLRKMENISVLNSIEKIDSTISKFIKR
jgi:flavoprotein